MPGRSCFGVLGKANEHSLKKDKVYPHGKLLPMGYNFPYKEMQNLELF